MLTKKQNLLETIRGGTPDRFVNQFEYLHVTLGFDPIWRRFPTAEYGKQAKNHWGVTNEWTIGSPAPMPTHDESLRVLTDITKWREQVTAPSLDFSPEEWAPLEEHVATVDKNEVFLANGFAPGVFEMFHFLQGMESALMNLAIYPDESKELLNYIADWNLAYVEQVFEHAPLDAIFVHDDYGSNTSTMMSPEMFEEFIVPIYKRLNTRFKELGAQIIVHHNDSYGATLVPGLIDMGIDIWQGVVSSNNIPELIQTYGGQISFMGGIDSTIVDVENWSPELIDGVVDRVCAECGKHYFIPNTTQGAAMSTYEGVYEEVSIAIDNASKKMF